MMYTNKALALKVLFAALLPAVFMAVNLLMLEDSLAQLFSFLAAALLYFIPFYATYFTIRKTRPESLKGYFVKDILFLLFPAAVSTVVCEMVFAAFSELYEATGFFSLALLGIYMGMMLFGWLLYRIAFSAAKKSE